MKNVFTIINMFLVAAIAFLCVDIMYKNIMPEDFKLKEKHPFGTQSKRTSRQQGGFNTSKIPNAIIVRRNLFNVEIEDSSGKQGVENNGPEKLEATKLKLVLWGTVTGQAQVYAVIEDKKNRQQALYETGDSVQGAKIKRILRHEVILNYQGKDQVLEMETDNKNVLLSRMPGKKIKPNTTSSNMAFMDGSSEEIRALIKQAKIRPHIADGEPDGLMVYGIRPISVFRQIGLRNGDIIKDINGTAIVSIDDAASLYTEITESDNARVTIFRRGKIKELVYQVINGQYSRVPFPDGNGKNKGDE